MEARKIMLPTWQQHIQESISSKHMKPELAGILNDIAHAGSLIGSAIRNYGLMDEITGSTVEINLHGEHVKKLDNYANDIFIRILNKNKDCSAIVSEEEPDAVITNAINGRYLVFVDPLDGSSNIDSHVSTGSIFSVYEKKSPGRTVTEEDLLQRGSNQVAAGYILYSSSVVMVYSAGQQVQGCTYHAEHNTYYLSHPNITMPADSSVYSINEGNILHFPVHVQKYLIHSKGKNMNGKGTMSLRYVGSMVADMHRNLLKGGVFMYPSTKDNPKGKLRLMYECNPFAYLIEKAGGKATDGLYSNVLDIQPEHIHVRCPIIIGSRAMMCAFEQFVPTVDVRRQRYDYKQR